MIAQDIKQKYKVAANQDSELMVTAGAMEALMCAFQTIVNPGDEVIMTSPGFSSHIKQILLAGGTP